METENSDVSRYLAEIVRAEYGELPAAQPVISTKREFAALVLMTLGSFVVPAIGWLVGVALMWTSPWLRMREKVMATVFVPGGVGGLFILAFLPVSYCSTTTSGSSNGPVVVQDTCPQVDVTLRRLEVGVGIVLALVALVLPIVLYVVARRRADADAQLRAGGSPAAPARGARAGQGPARRFSTSCSPFSCATTSGFRGAGGRD